MDGNLPLATSGSSAGLVVQLDASTFAAQAAEVQATGSEYAGQVTYDATKTQAGSAATVAYTAGFSGWNAVDLSLGVTAVAADLRTYAAIQRQESNTFALGEKVYGQLFGGNQYLDAGLVAEAKASQSSLAAFGEAAARYTTLGSVLLNVGEAAADGFSPRSDVKAAVGIGLATAAFFAGGEFLAPILIGAALGYSILHATGALDPLYSGLSDKRLLRYNPLSVPNSVPK